MQGDRRYHELFIVKVFLHRRKKGLEEKERDKEERIDGWQLFRSGDWKGCEVLPAVIIWIAQPDGRGGRCLLFLNDAMF